MPIVISKIFNANMYLDGTNELIGRATEIKLPDVSPNKSEHKGIGMIGVLGLPNGLQELMLSCKWSGFYADHLKAGANPFAAHQFLIMASHETYTAAGRAEEKPLVVKATGSWMKNPLGTLKAQEAADGYDDEITLTYLKVSLDGKELLEVDIFQNVWRVDGKDVLANFKKNLGA